MKRNTKASKAPQPKIINDEETEVDFGEIDADLLKTGEALFKLMCKESGKKDSSIFLDDGNEALKICLKKKYLTPQDCVQVAKVCKKISLESVAKAQEVYDQGTERRNKSSSNDELLKQYMESIPEKSRSKGLAVIKKFITAMGKALTETGGDPKCMVWGTMMRTVPFQVAAEALAKSCSSYLIPEGKWALQSAFIYNVIKDGLAFKIIEYRYALLALFMSFLNSKKLVEYIEPGSRIPGTSFISTNGQWMLNDKAVKTLQESADPDANFLQPEGMSMGSALGSEDPLVWLAGCVIIDVRYVTQTSEYKQGKGMSEIDSRVVANMNTIRTLAGFDEDLESVDLNKDAKGNYSTFVQTYFTALGRLRATIRGINAQVYGKKGGANTRSGKGRSVVASKSAVERILADRKMALSSTKKKSQKEEDNDNNE